MIKNGFLIALTALMAALFMAPSAPAEARHHCRSHASIGIGGTVCAPRTYVVRRYATPVIVAPAVPYSAPIYVNPPVVVAPPVYVEEVYVTRPCAPVRFGGLSLFFNLF